eukprot:1148812-Prymnesium_polylepis.3
MLREHDTMCCRPRENCGRVSCCRTCANRAGGRSSHPIALSLLSHGRSMVPPYSTVAGTDN